mmetsp:Transcript_118834/g.210067  ORF Transcript_118834/g.210067 Transcript_118834/m.210067 type:complete len:140 (+) Transcript_118834:1298-1717(+)
MRCQAHCAAAACPLLIACRCPAQQHAAKPAPLQHAAEAGAEVLGQVRLQGETAPRAKHLPNQPLESVPLAKLRCQMHCPKPCADAALAEENQVAPATVNCVPPNSEQQFKQHEAVLVASAKEPPAYADSMLPRRQRRKL